MGNGMTKFLDVYVGGERFDKEVDDIIPPIKERPFWLIMRNERVIASASKGVKVKYPKVEESKRAWRRITLVDESGCKQVDKPIEETPIPRDFRMIRLSSEEDVET